MARRSAHYEPDTLCPSKIARVGVVNATLRIEEYLEARQFVQREIE